MDCSAVKCCQEVVFINFGFPSIHDPCRNWLGSSSPSHGLPPTVHPCLPDRSPPDRECQNLPDLTRLQTRRWVACKQLCQGQLTDPCTSPSTCADSPQQSLSASATICCCAVAAPPGTPWITTPFRDAQCLNCKTLAGNHHQALDGPQRLQCSTCRSSGMSRLQCSTHWVRLWTRRCHSLHMARFSTLSKGTWLLSALSFAISSALKPSTCFACAIAQRSAPTVAVRYLATGMEKDQIAMQLPCSWNPLRYRTF